MEQQQGAGFGAELARVLSATTVAPPWWVLVTMVGLGVAASVSTSVVRQANLVGLIVHEGGHAALALLTGGRVEWIELSNTQAGETRSRNDDGLPAVLFLFAGYAAPPLAGLGVAALIAAGKAPLVLALGVVVTLLVLLVSRDVLTVGLVLTLGAVLAALLWLTTPWVQVWVACAVMGLLQTHSAEGVVDLVLRRVNGAPGRDDADNLYIETGISEYVWMLLWTVLILWCWWETFWLVWPR
ncbi:M50 family metallopeptidase [Actinopolyspora erythraea]|uniref:M50 family metallopeptidase n=1 Tax=Actinopolyspora erythraea TaxID=414996 RepID=UPI000693751A|nr:M50 family metallopeptidase [Actinopolyspora erythraea]